jgi:membrane protein
LTQIVTKLEQASSAQTFAGPIKSTTAHKTASGVQLIVAIVGALYSASSYAGAFMRAGNVIYETPEGRPFWKLRPLRMLISLLMLALLVVIALALVRTGPIVNAVAGLPGVDSTAVSVWYIAKSPVTLLLMIVMLTVLFYASPNMKLRGSRWVMPGAMFALLVWLLASIAFALYVANFGSCDKTYGTLGGVVAFLIWLWIRNAALLLGAELNAERERTHGLKGRGPLRGARDPPRRPLGAQAAKTT